MPTYLLLLRGGEFGSLGDEERRAMSARYLAWLRKADGHGRVTGGAPLHTGGKVLRRDAGGLRSADGPFAEAKDEIGGYYLFQAEDLEQAVAFSEDNPHLDYGGTVELRQLAEV